MDKNDKAAQPDFGAAQDDTYCPARDGFVKSATPGTGIIEIKVQGGVPEWLDPGADVRIVPAAASPASQPVALTPIYQVRFEQTWSWHDATEDAFHTFMPERRRIVYTAPAAVAPADAKDAAVQWISVSAKRPDRTAQQAQSSPKGGE